MPVDTVQSNDYDAEISSSLTQESVNYAVATLKSSGAFEKLVTDYRKKLESDRDFMLDFDIMCREVMEEKGISDLRIEHLLEKADALEKSSENHTQRVEETTRQVSTSLREAEATLTKKVMDALYDDINNLESNLSFN